MKPLSEKEFIKLDTENVVAIQINNGSVSVIADVETWEDCPYEDDRYRIEIYDTDRLNQQWVLDTDTIKKESLLDAIWEKRGCMCGGIYFMHEDDREEKNVYGDMLELLFSNWDTFEIYKCTDSEFSKCFHRLKNGVYIFVIEDDAQYGGD